jgi:hypothetical protein
MSLQSKNLWKSVPLKSPLPKSLLPNSLLPKSIPRVGLSLTHLLVLKIGLTVH